MSGGFWHWPNIDVVYRVVSNKPFLDLSLTGNSPNTLEITWVVNWEAVLSLTVLLNCREVVITHICTVIIYLEQRRWLHTIVSNAHTQLKTHAAIIKYSHHEYSQHLSLPPSNVWCRNSGNLEIVLYIVKFHNYNFKNCHLISDFLNFYILQNKSVITNRGSNFNFAPPSIVILNYHETTWY